MQAFLGADVDMNRANEVRPIFRSLGDIAQATGCAIVLIGHLNKAAGTQSTYRGLGSIDITAAVRSLLFIGKLKDLSLIHILRRLRRQDVCPPHQQRQAYLSIYLLTVQQNPGRKALRHTAPYQ